MVGSCGPSLPLIVVMLLPAIHAFCPFALDVCVWPRRTAVSSYMRKGNEAGTRIGRASSLNMLERAERSKKGVPGRMPMSMIRQGGDHDEMISLDSQIAKVEEEIDQVNRQIREVEKHVLDPDRKQQYWRNKEQLLRKEEEQLRNEEEQLRDLLIEVKRAQGSKNPQGFLSKPEGDARIAQP